MPNALFKALSQPQLSALPLSSVSLGLSETLGGALIMAHIRIASHAGGTMTAFSILSRSISDTRKQDQPRRNRRTRGVESSAAILALEGIG